MSDLRAVEPATPALSRRDVLALGGAMAAGLVVAGRQIAPVDDPIAGVRSPVVPETHFPGRSVALPARRGRKGFRPRPPYALGKALGSISIPALGIADTMYEGVDLWVLDGGPGHWPGTVLPGQAGNCVIA